VLSVNPNQVGPVPPQGCSTLTVTTFFEVPGPNGTKRRFPYHPGPSTQVVKFATSFGTLSPTSTRLDPNGSATSTLCSAAPGVATVKVTIPSFAPKGFGKKAKPCKQTKNGLSPECKKGKKYSGPPSASAQVTFLANPNPNPLPGQQVNTTVGPPIITIGGG
jgi:hypothetical protein